MAGAPSPVNGLRVLFITLEFRTGSFSGNGVYAQSQARALAKSGHRVYVVCGSPAGRTHEGGAEGDQKNLIVTAVSVPRDTWGRLDAGCGWREFAVGAGEDVALVRAIAAFKPDVVLGVDWSSLPCAKSLSESVERLQLRGEDTGTGSPVIASPEDDQSEVTPEPEKNAHLIAPFVYSNLRVFTRSDSETHRLLEQNAVAAAHGVLALCVDDADFITNNLHPPGLAVMPRVVLPPLREDVRLLATEVRRTENDANRTYLTCVVRLSPEKEPERFVSLVAELNRRGVFAKHAVVPVLCASTDGAYADGIRTAFGEAAEGTEGLVINEFLDAHGLRSLYTKTILNFHPCAKDAYGMTIVEAGAFSAPSIAQRGGGVGATALLNEASGASIGAEFAERVHDVEALCDFVEKRLGDRPGLLRVGERAKQRALAWDEKANADAVSQALRAAVRAFRHKTALGNRMWRLPDPAAVTRLQPLWRDATIGIWVGGDWVVVQHADACGSVPSVGNSPEWRLGSGGSGQSRKRKAHADMDCGNAEVTTQMVVVTAHNPMGAMCDASVNDLHASALATEIRGMQEEGLVSFVFPCVSVDAAGGAQVWREPGLAVTLFDELPNQNQALTRVMRLARKFGQAAVYLLSGDANGKWHLAVKPCFPTLGGLAVENVPLVTREPPRNMPTDPTDARCFWNGGESLVGL